MADQSDHQMGGVEESTTVDKGKGKAPQPPVEEPTDDDSSDESGAEAEVCFAPTLQFSAQPTNMMGIGRRYALADAMEMRFAWLTSNAAEPEDDDTMEEIDTSNIVQSRTRGKTIDYAKAAEELPEEDDDEDDDDFNGGDDAMEE